MNVSYKLIGTGVEVRVNLNPVTIDQALCFVSSVATCLINNSRSLFACRDNTDSKVNLLWPWTERKKWMRAPNKMVS